MTCPYPWYCCWRLLLCFCLTRLSLLLHEEVGCHACYETQQPSQGEYRQEHVVLLCLLQPRGRVVGLRLIRLLLCWFLDTSRADSRCTLTTEVAKCRCK